MKVIKKRNENSLITEFIEILKREISKKKIKRKRLSFVLTGGPSPKRLYEKLAKSKIDWSNVDLFWGDERFVSDYSKDSNFRLVNDLLIKKINIKKNNIFPFSKYKNNISKCAVDYGNNIKKYFKNKKIKFDIFLLGMGNDGHVVSIFPNSNEIRDNFIARPIFRKDFKRITLSLNLINNSQKIFLWLNNKTKTNIYKKLSGKGIEIPINNINKRNLVCFMIN